ncbi:MAG: hypothetical protein R6V85_12705 [Polyangia bacterium]
MSKNEVVTQLRNHLAELFDARFAGVQAVRFSRAQGFADGYMRALEDLGCVEISELVRIVGEERRNAAIRADPGPAASPPPPRAALDLA